MTDWVDHLMPDRGALDADVKKAIRRQRVYGPADFDPNPHVEPLAATSYAPGAHVLHDGRMAVVCLMPRPDMPMSDEIVIRYLDGRRERLLVSAWDCAAEVDSW